MTDPICILYDYAQLHEIPKYLTGGEYEESVRVVKAQREKLGQRHPEAAESLESLLREISLQSALELEAAFRAGFSLAMGLVRM